MKKIIKFLHENKIGKVINSLGVGALKGVPFLGNVITELTSNKSDELTGFGNTNKCRLMTYGVVSLLFIGRIIWPEHVNSELFTQLIDIITEL